MDQSHLVNFNMEMIYDWVKFALAIRYEQHMYMKKTHFLFKINIPLFMILVLHVFSFDICIT